MQTSSANAGAGSSVRWSGDRVLAEARRRTKELFTDNPRKVQSMLAALLEEAGWEEEEFIDLLCKDVVSRGTH